MMKLYRLAFVFLLSFFLSFQSHAKEFISRHCEPLVESNALKQKVKHSKGLLWQVSKDKNNINYLYGTIHVSDKEVTTLPEPVHNALHESDQFVMEALPDMEQMMSFSTMMFFTDGKKLSEFIDQPVYEKTTEILAAYQLGPDVISIMKPWAAFLMMNYPPDQGEPLDLVLLSLAQQNGAEVAGLESMQEQGALFNDLTLEEQTKLLTDTVCHYDIVEADFDAMKTLYLKRDLGGLYNYSQRYSMSNEVIYEKLMKKLIDDRNDTMVERMQPMLEKGKSFIAIGAMHLTGSNGVLSQLEKKGYTVKVIF